MKKVKAIQLLSISIVSLMLVFTSCKKNNSDTEVTPANGTLLFHLHTDADTNEVGAYGDTMVMTGGRRITVTKAQLYISGIQLVKSDGSVINGPAINVLKVNEAEQYVIGSVPSGNYQSVKFNVGLSAATNASTPATSDAVLNRPDMWFGSGAQPGGFVFVNFQGSIDTATAPWPWSGAALTPFSYKIGTNALLKNVSMPVENFTVVPNQAVEVHINIDYAKLFKGVQINNAVNLNLSTPSDNTGALAKQIANNIPAMFSYEE